MKYAVENGDAKIRSLPKRIAHSSDRLNFTRVGAPLNFVDRGDDLDPPDLAVLGKSDRWRLAASLV